MNLVMKRLLLLPKFSVNRTIFTTQYILIKQWRLDQGLPANRNAEGILTDTPDYTFLDGRPTPLLQKQKKRMLRNQEYATEIVRMCSELEFAKERHQNMLRAKQEERDAILRDRLKPKGDALKHKK